MKRILVTGGAGFLGSHLCERLLNEGNTVFCLDNFYSGRMSNIKPLLGHENFTLFRQDVEEPFDEQVDEIFNLACPASPPFYQRFPVKTLKTCFLGALNMLDLAARYRVKILQASTSEVYGDALVHPQTEDYRGNVNPNGIRACYDEGKRVAESLFFDHRREFGTRIKIARIFNTYGPNMSPNDGRVISNFITQALRRENLTVFGDGKQTRSFCYVDDLIDGIVRLMASDDDVQGPVNLGNPQERSILDIAGIILKTLDSGTEVTFLPLPGDDPKQRCPDIARAKRLLDWEPKTPLETGLMRTIAYFRDYVAE